MSRISGASIVILAASACSSAEGGGSSSEGHGGGSTIAVAASSTGSSIATGGAASTSESASTSASGGGGGGSTAGSGTGGAPEVSPETCFQFHTEAACRAAGCNIFLAAPDAYWLEDSICGRSNDTGLCFIGELGGSMVETTYVRQFEADGPAAFHMNNGWTLEGWERCTPELMKDRKECCCPAQDDFEPNHPCAGITPAGSG